VYINCLKAFHDVLNSFYCPDLLLIHLLNAEANIAIFPTKRALGISGPQPKTAKSPQEGGNGFPSMPMEAFLLRESLCQKSHNGRISSSEIASVKW
jgi:hypothetical protein